MSLVVIQSPYFWLDLQRQVDWYRDGAGSGVATNYLDTVEETLEKLARMPQWDTPDSMIGRSWPESAPGASENLFTGT